MNLSQLLTLLLNDQHVDYEADLESPDLGLDTCPFENLIILEFLDTDDEPEPPCNYCGSIARCACPDRGSRFTNQ